MIKMLGGVFSTGALLLALLSSVAPRLSGGEASARSCYKIWVEAPKMGSYYQHLVYVENDCEYWLQCSVWTDVGSAAAGHAERRAGDDRARRDQR